MTLLGLTLLLAATEPRLGPSRVELAAAIERYPFSRGRATYRADKIKAVTCKAFPEEPTEFRCRFRAWDIDRARWTQRAVIVTFDKEWLVLGMD
jgi:hypothetical protein